MAHLSSQNLMQGPTSHDRNFRPRLRLQKQSLTTPPLGCRVHHAAQAMRHWELAATQRTEIESNTETSTSPGESGTRLPGGQRLHRHWCHRQSSWSAQKRDGGGKEKAICCRSSCKWLCMSDYLQLSISHFWPFNVVKCCQINSRHGVATNWPNIATKFARRGTMRNLLLSNLSSWHRGPSAMQWTEFESNHESPTSPGENSARLPTGPRPHRHWCSCQSTWSAQERAEGIYRRRGRMAYRKRYVYAMQAPILQKPRLCGR